MTATGGSQTSVKDYSATLPGQSLDNFQEYPGAGTSPVSGFMHMLRETLGYAQAMVASIAGLVPH